MKSHPLTVGVENAELGRSRRYLSRFGIKGGDEISVGETSSTTLLCRKKCEGTREAIKSPYLIEINKDKSLVIPG